MGHSFYNTREWRELREMIRGRDKWRCQLCGISVREKGASQVDHIIPRRTAPALALDPNNLRTLCRSCHNKFDKARGHKSPRAVMPVDESGYPESWK